MKSLQITAVLVSLLTFLGAPGAFGYVILLDIDIDNDPTTLNEITTEETATVRVILQPTELDEWITDIWFGLGGTCWECEYEEFKGYYGTAWNLYLDGPLPEFPQLIGYGPQCTLAWGCATPECWFEATSEGFFLTEPVFIATFTASVAGMIHPGCPLPPSDLKGFYNWVEYGNVITLGAPVPGPVVSNLTVTPATYQALITFDTDELATSSVRYGLTDLLELGEVTGSTSLTHHLVIAGLEPETEYYYQVRAEGLSGITTLDVATFTSLPYTEQNMGSVVAWGFNDMGQCDIPAPNAQFIALAGGGFHSLGLKSDGRIVAWGLSSDGQCDVPEPNEDFIAIAGGTIHSLGLKSDGTIVAWGHNLYGECDIPAPNQDFVAVVGSDFCSFGLKSDGTIVAWGLNDFGQCDVPEPNEDFIAVWGYSQTALGLKSDGTIVAWGQNDFGQCDIPAPNQDFVAVAGGGVHSLGLKSDGRIVAWGRNWSGECDIPAPNADFVAVAGGGAHSIGLKIDGTIVAWGLNDWGQCDIPAPNAEFIAVAGGQQHSLAIRSFSLTYDFTIDIAVDHDTGNRVATSPSASDGYDPGIDQLQIQADPLIWFPHPEWSVPEGDQFDHDIRASFDPVNALKIWTFVVDVQNSEATTRPVTIEFSPSFSAGDGVGLALHDRTTGQTLDLWRALEYTFNVAPYSGEVREFDLFVGLLGWTEEDIDADGVPNIADACHGSHAPFFDRDGDGCVDAVIGSRHLEYWPQVDMPLPYVIHVDGAPGITDGSDLAAIQAGFDAWAAIPGIDISVAYQGTTTQPDAHAMDRVNMVTFNDPDWSFGSGVLAVGLSTSFTVPTWHEGVLYRPGQIFDADMIFNPNQHFRTPTMGTGIDIQSIATHEAGHMLGLSHSSVVTSTMFYVLPPLANAAELELEDRLAMLKAYPDEATLAVTSHLRGTVTSGWTGAPVGGAIVFAISAAGDTLGCEYSLPHDGSYHFIGLPDGEYRVAIHPLNYSSAINYIGPININALIRDHTDPLVLPEFWVAGDSAYDDPEDWTSVTVMAGTTASADFVTNVDDMGPRLVSVTPLRDASAVPIDTAVLIRFSESVDPESFRGQFNLASSPDGNLLPGAAALVRDDSTFAYVPTQNLVFATTYFVELGAGISDRFGNTIATQADSLSFAFTTEPRPPVAIDSIVPRKGGEESVIVINGTGFADDIALNSVYFGDLELTVLQASTTQLVVAVPAGFAATTDQLFVSNDQVNETSNVLAFTVLETETVLRGFEIASVALPAQGRAVEVAPDGALAFIATDAGLSAVDVTAANAPSTSALSVPGGLDALAPTPDGDCVLGISRDTRRIYRFQVEPLLLASEVGTGAEPLGIALAPSGRKAFVPTVADEIQIWDYRSGSLTYEQQIGAIAIPQGNLLGKLTTDPAGEYLLALSGSGQLFVVDLGPDTLLTSVAIGPDPRDVVVAPGGDKAYITSASGRVSELSLTDFRVLAQVSTGGALLGADIKPTGTFVYAANNQLDFLDVIDLRVGSPTYRSIAGRIPHRANPVDLVFSPDGLYSYSLAAGHPELVITATGEGPMLASLSPPAGPPGTVVQLAGAGFSGATVDFNGHSAAILQGNDTALTVVVPGAATSGPVTVIGAEVGQVSNPLQFAVLVPSEPGALRTAAVVPPSGVPQLAACLAVSPAENVVAVGDMSGNVHLLDIDPQSATYHGFVGITQTHLSAAITAIVIAADAARAYIAADGEPSLAVLNTQVGTQTFGQVLETIALPGTGPGRIAIGPDCRQLLVPAGTGSSNVHLIDLTTNAVTTVSLQGSVPGLAGDVMDIAIHPGGRHAYLAMTDDDPAVILVMHLEPGSGAHGSVVGSLQLPAGSPAEVPIALAFTPSGTMCYVLTSQETGDPGRSLVALTTTSPTAPLIASVTPITTAALPMDERLAVAPAGDRLLLNIRDDGFYLVDLANPWPMSQAVAMPTGAPLDFGFTPSGARVYAVSSSDNSIHAFDFHDQMHLHMVWGDEQSGVTGEFLPTPIRVRVVEEALQDGVASISVTFTVTEGGGSLRSGGHDPDIPLDTVAIGTDSYGYAQVDWRMGDLGAQQLMVASPGLVGSPLMYSATAVSDPLLLPLRLVEELLSPAATALAISTSTSILAVFTRPVALSTINDASVFVTAGADNVAVPAVIGIADGLRRVSLTPRTPLPYNTVCTLNIGPSIQADNDGTALSNPGQWSFTTMAEPPAPFLGSVSVPGSLPYLVVVLSGTGFSANPNLNQVTFNGAPAAVIACTPNTIHTRVPLTATSGPILVTVGGQSSNPLHFEVFTPLSYPPDEVIQRIETGTPTRTATVTPDGTMLYAIAPDADLVKPIDLSTYASLPGIPVGDFPRAVIMHPGGSYIYVANELSRDVSVIDVRPGSPTCNKVVTTIQVGAGPYDLVITPDGERVIVVKPETADLSIIDSNPTSANFNQVISRVETGTASQSVTVTPDGTRIYVGTETGYLILEAIDYGVIRMVSTGTATRSVEITPDGTLLVLLNTQGEVSLFDILPGSSREDQVIGQPSSGTTIRDVAVSPDGTLIYLVEEGQDAIRVLSLAIDPTVYALEEGLGAPPTILPLITTLVTGSNPQDAVFAPMAPGRLYVPCAGDNTMVVFGQTSIADVVGQVIADCPEPETVLFGVVVDLFDTATGDIFQFASTDADGFFVMPGVPGGDYIATVVPPLGYVALTQDIPITVAGGASEPVTFMLTCLAGTGAPRGIGYWKHQIAVATGSNGHAEIDGETLCGYLDDIQSHFNENAINQVVVYQPPDSGICADKLEVAKSLLNLRGQQQMIARARQHFMATLLNIAAGHLMLFAPVSEDGRTLSQAVTYCDWILDDPSGDHETAKDIAETINQGRLIAAGIIPADIEHIAYRQPGETVPTRFALAEPFPNPFNPFVKISFDIPRMVHVSLKIHDVSGRLVCTLVDEPLLAANHRVLWYGNDQRGAAVASGLYFCRIVAGDFVATRKLMLLK